MLVDSHCHLPLLDLGKVGGDIGQVLANAREVGVERFLCVSIDLDTYPQVIDLARTFDEVYASVGVHPNSEVRREPCVRELCELADDPRVVAIGETGLDFFRSSGDLEWQRERFRTHIEAAKRSGKPLIVHTRDAREDVLRILEQEGANQVGGVMHCFVEDWETAKRAMDLGFHISFSGIVTFKNAPMVQDVAKKMPLDRLLVETDSPYLAPVPHRGKENQPGYVRYVADFIAVLKGISIRKLEEVTTENFFSVFKGG